MADWDIAVAIISVCLSIISILPVVLPCLSQLYISICEFVRPAGNWCQRITREEVSLRSLHICSEWTQNTLPKYVHTDVALGPMGPDPPLCEYFLPSKFFNMNPALKSHPSWHMVRSTLEWTHGHSQHIFCTGKMPVIGMTKSHSREWRLIESEVS